MLTISNVRPTPRDFKPTTYRRGILYIIVISDYAVPLCRATAQITIEPNARASIDFTSEESDHFAVSYRQCSLETPQPLQIQYGGKLNYVPFIGGCIYVSLT